MFSSVAVLVSIGGIICLIDSLYYLFSGSYGEIISFAYTGSLNNMLLASVPLSLLSIIASSYITKQPGRTSIFLLISSLVLFFFLRNSEFFPGSILIFAAALFTLLQEKLKLSR